MWVYDCRDATAATAAAAARPKRGVCVCVCTSGVGSDVVVVATAAGVFVAAVAAYKNAAYANCSTGGLPPVCVCANFRTPVVVLCSHRCA